jgi:hypothetical protein
VRWALVDEVNFIGWPCCRLTRSCKLDGDGSRYVACMWPCLTPPASSASNYVMLWQCLVFPYPPSVCDFFPRPKILARTSRPEIRVNSVPELLAPSLSHVLRSTALAPRGALQTSTLHLLDLLKLCVNAPPPAARALCDPPRGSALHRLTRLGTVNGWMRFKQLPFAFLRIANGVATLHTMGRASRQCESHFELYFSFARFILSRFTSGNEKGGG